MSEHTPGPWKVTTSEMGTMSLVVDSRGGFVAETDDEYGEVDARLIAAAPDLLAALEEHLRLWGPDQDMPDMSPAIAQARAAVAKARGEDVTT